MEIFPTSKYGLSIGFPPSQPSRMQSIKKNQKAIFIRGLKAKLRTCTFIKKGNNNKIKIAPSSNRTPSNLSGTDRKIA